MENYNLRKKLFWFEDLDHTTDRLANYWSSQKTTQAENYMSELVLDLEWEIKVFDYLYENGPFHVNFEKRFGAYLVHDPYRLLYID